MICAFCVVALLAAERIPGVPGSGRRGHARNRRTWWNRSGTIDLNVCIKNGSLEVFASNVIVHHLRIRRGFIQEGDAGDALNIKGKELHDIIADHISTSWATDENLTLTNAQDVTMGYSISAEALYYFNPEQSPTGMRSDRCSAVPQMAAR